MTFAYLGQGVYTSDIVPKFYIINTSQDNYIIIDSSNSEYNQIIQDILEITGGTKPKMLILTSCKKDSSGGASLISRFFGIPVVAHYPDSIGIRHGECNSEKYSPATVSIEIRQKIYKIEDSIKIINSRSPTLGSIIIEWKNFLFIGSNQVSKLGNSIKYICNTIDCMKV
ncbi:hypothetical protein DFR86_06300 [Acidianus sulfidivorans JP7]|uniref:MBL fold metallo-hydrolase n=1 Tax=Acidianus sulfidivorans JP7 TaxID=619593 RepID=A0A2U9IMB6_9CREN|nr:MBL fold metallo-hydrolase [Acidianus sulfidivorans]AWR97209.1 hypothetical protein DFR86_06300 [Acidianus sulfidivorans JP7]